MDIGLKQTFVSHLLFQIGRYSQHILVLDIALNSRQTAIQLWISPFALLKTKMKVFVCRVAPRSDDEWSNGTRSVCCPNRKPKRTIGIRDIVTDLDARQYH